jgi:hypothetical protein
MKNKVLLDLSHPKINKLVGTFKDASELAMVLELAKGVD